VPPASKGKGITMSKGYNGWVNYETWLVALWLDNDCGSSDYWREVAEELWDEEDPGRSQRLLADRLKDEVMEGQPELTGMYADMLNAAFSEVDWDEIASHYCEDCKA
jgi:hypothetical protein